MLFRSKKGGGEMDIELSGRAQEENYIAGMKAGIQLMLEALR